MAHKGLREWTGEEVGSLFLGQNGFHVLKGTSEVTAASKGIEYWIAFKAVDGSAGYKAQSYNAGDDFTQDGAYGTGLEITVADGDIIYGAFDKITVGSATEYVIAYIGR
jgi:hypothetical protein